MRNTAEQIFAHIKETGGATVQLYWGEDHLMDARDGDVYLVGGARGVNSRFESAETFTADSVRYWLQVVNEQYRETGGMDYYSCAGFWVHDGVVHIDLVDAIAGREFALSKARERNELAIYHLPTGETVWLESWVTEEAEEVA